MISEPPNYDPITVWQSQTEHSTPALEDVLKRAHQFKAKDRRAAFIFGAAFILHIAISLTEDFAGVEGRLWWVGVIRFALLTVWVYYLPFRTFGTNNSSPISLRVAAMTPVLDFYRRELVRRRDYFRDDYRGVLQLVLLGAAFIIYSVFYPRLFLVFSIPLAVWTVLLYKRRKDELPQIQREIETLDRLQKESL
jgi:hypothetical protein